MQNSEEWMSFGEFCGKVFLPNLQALTIALVIRLLFF